MSYQFGEVVTAWWSFLKPESLGSLGSTAVPIVMHGKITR